MVLDLEMSKTYQYRKVMKPLLERKRRARINKCLDELKDLMIESLTEEGEHITRLEKADILELTVEHLRKVKFRKHHSGSENFRSGYIQAANEVSKALASIPGVDITTGTKLMTYLGHRLNRIQHAPSTTNHVEAPRTPASPTTPLTISCGGMYAPPVSPVSSGYGSDIEMKEPSSGGLLKIAQNSNQKMWRPW